ncbi:alkyl/aryl-sulfatase [Cupriavidus numazuensis]|uniref:Alkyl/aryl-sulfatase YjcS n=1 Tax=Cupriavidus numazuensis TaxID=221992 RepID=A0ABM8TKB3_9BURK|nr:alkyl sulfatase dimerization domain-containing protein [Cupriavidus numazuensis]CAG2151195.1 Putative alkyl/aryl-sulfatase YjcS [Cupriavidus numazuensis]
MLRKSAALGAALFVMSVMSAIPAFTLSATNAFAAEPSQPGDATAATRQANADVLGRLPFANRQDFEDARRGFIGTIDSGEIRDASGRVIWNLDAYAFLKDDAAPASVNPSLWRQAQLNLNHGLFQVTDHIYQVRGFDLSNMTIVEGNTGVILIDPLLTAETARAALDLYYKHRPKKPVVAVIYTHSHVDHFGGVKGVISEDDVKAGRVKILAPEGFMEEAVSENIYAGNAMSRRAQYMYGPLLPKGVRGQVDAGLGKTVSLGTVTLIPPTDLIQKSGETRTIDGVQMEFQMAPGSEAPSEMLLYFPQWKALCAAEDATHNLHNLYTIRGAQVRDANQWWRALDETADRFGNRTEVIFAQHHWPKWGQREITAFLAKQRDGYKYIHDQSLRLANQGYTMTEIAEMVKLPPSLASQWDLRDYYGTVNHNAKAIYQRYLGWYSGNPADLHPLPPEQSAQRYVQFMGGADKVLEQARKSYAQGDYRWVAEVVKHVVFADPSNQAARRLEADALEQMGYQAESAAWRSAYLMGAYELRNGVPQTASTQTASPDMVRAMSDTMFLDFLAVRVNSDRAAGKQVKINWIQPDTGKRYALSVDNSVFMYRAERQHPDAQVTLTAPRAVLIGTLLGQTTLQAAVGAGQAKVDGDAAALQTLFGMLDKFDPKFEIVAP